MDTAPSANQKFTALITAVDSYLGREIAGLLTALNFEVYATGHGKTPSNLITKKNFTFIDIDLAQHFPAYLPTFNYIFHLDNNIKPNKNIFEAPHLTSQTTNILKLAQNGFSQVFLFVGLSINSSIYEDLIQGTDKQFLKLFLVGDVYGPGMDFVLDDTSSRFAEGQLTNLLAQAVKTDKVILENEGLKIIYPAYISDCLTTIENAIFKSDKNVQYLTSEEPKTALSCAYEIQNAARLILEKDLSLFFKGQPQEHPAAEPSVSIHLGFSPKVQLTAGLKNTFEAAINAKEVKISNNQPIPQRPLPANLPQDKTKKSLTVKIPKVKLGLKKKFILIPLLILLAIILKTGFDIYWATTSLKTARAAATNGDFAKAKAKSQSARDSFIAAERKTKILLYPISIFIPQKIKSINLTLGSASLTSSSLFNFIEGADVFAKNIKAITAKDNSGQLDLETPQAFFKKANLDAERASTGLAFAKNHLPFESRLQKAQKSQEELASLSKTSYQLSAALPDLIGNGAKKSYLVLLQNNTELRPGGGFIGNVGLIEFDQGKLKNITVEDVYNLDGQLKEKIEPPKELKEKLGVKQFYLRDSNWNPEFSLNAQTAQDFYKKETGTSVDGTVAVDLNFIQGILEKLGPIKLADYSEQITAANLFERGEYYSEIGFFPGSTQKKDFFGSLTRSLLDKILNSSSNASWVAVLTAAHDATAGKHLMFSFENPVLTSLAIEKGAAGSLVPSTYSLSDENIYHDFLALSEANLGANKVNRFLKRQVSYDATVRRDADITATLKITYTNESQAETWPGGKYVNFLRVYIPAGASLEKFQNGTKTDIKDVQVFSQNNLTVFATYIDVPIKSTREVTFVYHLPKNIKIDTVPIYNLYVSKQPGTLNDPLEFKFNLPSYLVVKSTNVVSQPTGKQNLDIKTDLSQDRQFQIEIVKK